MTTACKASRNTIRLGSAVARLFEAGRSLQQALDDVADSEALTDLGRLRLKEYVYVTLEIQTWGEDR